MTLNLKTQNKTQHTNTYPQMGPTTPPSSNHSLEVTEAATSSQCFAEVL